MVERKEEMLFNQNDKMFVEFRLGLLVYEIRDEVLVLMLYRLGTHSELFKK